MQSDSIIPKIPGIPIDGNNLEILETPDEFYKTLLEESSTAEHRISLSSLYLGTGLKEKQLVAILRERLNSSNIKLTVLLDLLRGTRLDENKESSVTVLESVSEQGNVMFYHTPQLNGILKKILPARVDEIVGLQHMKIYVFDDNVLMSGANLSSSYFVDRQDRYYLFRNCKLLADFFDDVIKTVGESSFILKENALRPHPECEIHPYKGNAEEYRKVLKNRIEHVIQKFIKNCGNAEEISKTLVFPILQMGLLGINQETEFLREIFGGQHAMKLLLASGYFNLTEEYEDLICNAGRYEMKILNASPYANGFFGSHGLSRYVPSLYSSISNLFLKKVSTRYRNSVTMHEYYRNGWTFHAKGLWIERDKRMATMIGSSNYGYRSAHRDLEAQVLVVTSEEDVMHRISMEQQSLFNYSSIMDKATFQKPEHHVPFFVRIMTRLIRSFL